MKPAKAKAKRAPGLASCELRYLRDRAPEGSALKRAVDGLVAKGSRVRSIDSISRELMRAGVPAAERRAAARALARR